MRRPLVVAGRYTPSLFGGGGDHFAYALLKALSQTTNQYELYGWYQFCTRPLTELSPATTPDELGEIRTRRRIWLRRRLPRTYLAAKRAIEAIDRRRAMGSLRPLLRHNALVHANDPYVASLLGRDVSYIYTHHAKGSLVRQLSESGESLPESLVRYYRAIDLAAMSRARFLIFPSHSAMKLAADEYPELLDWPHVRVVHTGVEARLAPSLTAVNREGLIEVLSIAHHVPEKGLDLTLRLFRALWMELRKHGRDAILRNVGRHGPLTSVLQAQALELGIASAIKWEGFLSGDDVRDLLTRSALVIHTPRVVVFDLALLEAMGAGVPVAASAALGNIEALGNDYPFLLRDGEFSRLARDVAALLCTPSEWLQLSRILNDRFRRLFALDRMTQRYLELYAEIP